MIRRAVTSGTRVVRDIVELVDLEARGVEDVSALVRAVPKVPWRVAMFVRDVVTALAEMPTREASPWRSFRARFAAVHDTSARRR
jgi:hypothetical protein